MSVVPFLVIAVATGTLSVLLRRETRASAAIGVLGLLAATVAASTIHPEAPAALAGGGLAGSAFLRLVLIVCCLGGLGLLVVGAATAWTPVLPATLLLTLAGTAVALATSNAVSALVAATLAALGGVLAVGWRADGERGAGLAAWELRALVGANAVAVVALAVIAWAGTGRQPALVGLGFLGLAVAVGIRLGTIPFHLRVARVSAAVPDVALPVLLAWAPVAFLVATIGSVEHSLPVVAARLGVEPALVVLAAGASIGFGTAAALLHEDVPLVVAYSIVADAGIALLALAAPAGGSAEPLRIWLVAFLASKTALGAWSAGLRGTFGPHRLRDLAGWARQAPLLGVALAGIGIASVGLPGMAVFGARRTLADAAAGGLLGIVLVVASIASVAIYVRLLAVGLARPSSTVLAVPAWRPTWPPRGLPATWPLPRGWLPAAWRQSRSQVAASAVVVLAAAALLVAAGGLGVRQAASSPGPALSVPVSSSPADGPAIPYSSGASTQRSISRS